MGSHVGKRKHFLSQVRLDREVIEEKRPLVFKYLALILLLFATLSVPVEIIKSAAEVSYRQVVVDRESFEILPVSVNAKTVDMPPIISPTFTAEVQHWSENIARWAQIYQIDPNLIATVIQIESCGDPSAVSSANAQGLFQVMPFHFGYNENKLDPETNARRGLNYLKRAMELASGEPFMALGGYNGGHSVIADMALWADETKDYAYWGAGILNDIANDRVPSTRLNEWLSAGGASLCRQAAASLRIP